jgi:hypothetical protein
MAIDGGRGRWRSVCVVTNLAGTEAVGQTARGDHAGAGVPQANQMPDVDAAKRQTLVNDLPLLRVLSGASQACLSGVPSENATFTHSWSVAPSNASTTLGRSMACC